MTGPLINRDDLEDRIFLAFNKSENTAGAVIAYLREVLTPEALWPTEEYGGYNGHFLHRRIFGEVRCGPSLPHRTPRVSRDSHPDLPAP